MKDKKGKIKNSKRGMVLVIAVTIIVMLAIIGVGLLQLGRNARLQAVKDVLQISARSAADAGIEHAVRHMINSWKDPNNSKTAWIASWNDLTVWTNPAVPATPANYISGHVSLGGTFGNASFDCNIYKGTRNKGYQIISTGTAAGVTRTVHAAVMLSSPFYDSNHSGFCAKGSIYAYPNTIFSTIPANGNFTIQSNSTAKNAITIKPGITIPGDVLCGPGGDPDIAIDLAKNSYITGDANAAGEAIEFLPVYRPTGFEQKSSLENYKVGSDYIISKPGPGYEGIQINSGISTSSTLYIGDPAATDKGLIRVYVTGTTNLNSGANLIVNEGYSLILYLGGDTKVWPGSTISYTTTPPTTDALKIDAANRIIIKGTVNPVNGTSDCQSLILQPNGDFYCVIYAPDSSLTMQPGGDFCGAIVGAKDITLRPGGAIQYTLPSFDSDTLDEILIMGIKPGSWWEE